MKQLAFIFCLMMSMAAHSQRCAFRLTGHIHIRGSHENVAAATVTLIESGQTRVTDLNGDFRFDSLCAQTYQLMITHAGFDTSFQQVVITRHQHVDIDLVPARKTLDEVTVVGRRDVNTGIRKELSAEEMEKVKGLSLAESLSRLTGVTMLETGSTISKPVIHGLHSNRILTINNGVRQEGQQWGNEHAPEIDPFVADKLTVVKGVDELRYGSDAIGGVILIEPKSLRTLPGYSAELNAIYHSNTRGSVVSAMFEHLPTRVPLSYRIQGTYRRSGNVATPHYTLNNSAVKEASLSILAGWRSEHVQSEIYYSLFKTEIGIFAGAHIGNLSDLQSAIESERPDPVFTGDRSYSINRPNQEALHQLIKAKTTIELRTSRINVLIAAQHNRRKEFDVVRNVSTGGPQIDLSVFTFSEDVSWEHPRKNNLTGVVGINAMQQDNTYIGRYLVPNYRSFSYGAYGVEKWAKDDWNLQAGLRYDFKNLTTRRLRSSSGLFSTEHNFSTLAFSFNAGYDISTAWKINSNVSLSTRAPFVNELLTNGIHHGTGTYEVGDIYLTPERSFQISLNNAFQTKDKKFGGELTLYRNVINDFIYQQPKPDEPVLTIRGAFPKIVYASTDAILYGMDALMSWQAHKKVLAISKVSLLRAKNKDLNDWLIGMPADRIFNEVKFDFGKIGGLDNGTISFETEHVFRQVRFPGDRRGKQDYKLPPAGYTLMHAHVSADFKIGKIPFTFHFSGRNLFNKAYRDYLNAFRYFTDEMGRNISLRVTVRIDQ